MPLLTKNFSLNELTVTTHTDEGGQILLNSPGTVETLYLRILAETILEPFRKLCDCPLRVNSGFRGEAVERAVQKRPFPLPLKPSQHRLGQAADVMPLGLDLDKAYLLLYESALPYDQLLLESVDGARWIHVSVAPLFSEPRRQALTTSDGLSWLNYQPPSTEGKLA